MKLLVGLAQAYCELYILLDLWIDICYFLLKLPDDVIGVLD